MMNTIPHYDLVVIGGGINGTGIAADAAGRGLAGGTVRSGRSGQRHVFSFQQIDPRWFALSGTLRIPAGQRGTGGTETLLRMAPHIAHPMRFRLPTARTCARRG